MPEDELDHLHIVVTAHGLSRPPQGVAEVEDWLGRLIDAVGMKVLIAPHAVYCHVPGNEGVTGIACLETSHCSVHAWTTGPRGPYLKMDLYSCRAFEPGDVLALVAEFGPTDMGYTLLDRNGMEAEVIQSDYVASDPDDGFEP